MHKKDIVKGLVIGLIANIIGLFLASILLSKGDNFMSVLKAAFNEGFIGKLVSIGAVLNLVVFFIFIKKKQDYKARGVLLATVIVAILTFLFKFM